MRQISYEGRREIAKELPAKAFEIAASVGMIVPWVLESNGCEDE